MALTFAQQKTRVFRRLKWDETDSVQTAIAEDALNAAYHRVNARRRWRRLELTETVAVIAGATYVDTPATFRSLRLITIWDASQNSGILRPRDWHKQILDVGDPAIITAGAPGIVLIGSAASGSAGKRIARFTFDRPTDLAYTIRFVGTAVVPDLANASDVPWFDDTYHDMLPDYALAELMSDEAGFSADVRQNHQGRADQLLAAMVDEDATNETLGPVSQEFYEGVL